MTTMFVFCILKWIISVQASPTIDLIINEANSDGTNFYSINIKNEEWLQSGALEAYFNHQWCTSNPSTIQDDSSYELMQILSSSTLNDRCDDFGGFFTEKTYEWQAGTVIFETNFKIYNDGKAISFLQSFPNGAKGTAFTPTKPNSNCAFGTSVVPLLSFPSFNVRNISSKYASEQLGYLTFTDTFSTAKWGKTPVPTSDLAGLQHGPVVLFDNTSDTAMVISTNDNFAVSTQSNQMSDISDWRLGISSQVVEIPQGFVHETVIVIGEGINDVMLNEWSSRVKAKYHTMKVKQEKDIIISYLGYWTDNGAYYYGDSWGATGNPMNLTCCSLDVFKDVKKHLDTQQIPIQYWQMDDWWYYGLHPNEYIKGDYWSGVKSVQHWNAPNEYYPGGIAALSESLGVPLLLYGPYFSPDNDWMDEFWWMPQDAGFVLPSSSDSYRFYSTLFDYGINASSTTGNTGNGNGNGMVGYEVDFMSCLSGIPIFRTRIGTQQEWLDGMNKAAEERGLVIQYCMALPMELMQSLSLSQVTNGRASGDYASGVNFNIGAGSLLWSALGLKSSKDNFWTSFNVPIPSKNHYNGGDHNSTDVHAMAALFSNGPVGISDRSGYSNSTLIMRLCNAEGKLLQPMRTMTAIDDQFIYDVFYGENINVWSTEFGAYDAMGNVDIYGHIVLATNMKQDYILRYDSFTPSLNAYFMTVIRNWYNYDHCNNGTLAVESGCVLVVNADSDTLYTLSPQKIIPPMLQSFELLHIIPRVTTSSIVFLGEWNKYVSVSQHRFESLIVNGNSLSVNVKGKPNEIVSIAILIPNTAETDWTVNMYDITIEKSGISTFTLSVVL